ncbi:MAG: L,D-transpeptidase [Myxococcales bacterium]
MVGASQCARLARMGLCGLVVILGCGSRAPAPKETSTAHADATADAGLQPSKDSPRIAALSLKAEIFERPDPKSRLLGYIRLGQSLARSPKPVDGTRCAEGWYQVAPRGHLCAGGDDATLDLNHKLIQALGTKPDLSRPMPYTYGFVRRDATLWNFVPSQREMNKYEFAFQGHLKEYAKNHVAWNRIDKAGANHVPLDDKGNATLAPKDVPPTPPALDENNLFPTVGDGEIPWWLKSSQAASGRTLRRQIPNISTYQAPFLSPFRGKAFRHAGLAVIGSFRGGKAAASRKFTVTLDGRLIAEDKIKPHFASPFHGLPLNGSTPFPFVIVRRPDGHRYSAEGRKLSTRLTWRDVIPLTGKKNLHSNKQHFETKAGFWVHEDDISLFDTPAPPQSFDWKKVKWIDVGIWYQTLVLYEGDKPVYATLVSSGADGLGDPFKTKSTIRGEFRVQYKHVTSTMDADDPENRFELRDVPWVQYFEGGYAVHGAYWHDDFGRMRSHGCVNLAPVDARRVFFWTDPPLPDGWHAVKSGPSMGEGTWIRVRR